MGTHLLTFIKYVGGHELSAQIFATHAIFRIPHLMVYNCQCQQRFSRLNFYTILTNDNFESTVVPKKCGTFIVHIDFYFCRCK